MKFTFEIYCYFLSLYKCIWFLNSQFPSPFVWTSTPLIPFWVVIFTILRNSFGELVKNSLENVILLKYYTMYIICGLFILVRWKFWKFEKLEITCWSIDNYFQFLLWVIFIFTNIFLWNLLNLHRMFMTLMIWNLMIILTICLNFTS